MGKWIAGEIYVTNVLWFMRGTFMKGGLDGLREGWCVNVDAFKLYLSQELSSVVMCLAYCFLCLLPPPAPSTCPLCLPPLPTPLYLITQSSVFEFRRHIFTSTLTIQIPRQTRNLHKPSKTMCHPKHFIRNALRHPRPRRRGFRITI